MASPALPSSPPGQDHAQLPSSPVSSPSKSPRRAPPLRAHLDARRASSPRRQLPPAPLSLGSTSPQAGAPAFRSYSSSSSRMSTASRRPSPNPASQGRTSILGYHREAHPAADGPRAPPSRFSTPSGAGSAGGGPTRRGPERRAVSRDHSLYGPRALPSAVPRSTGGGSTAPGPFLLTVLPPLHLPHDPPHPRASQLSSGYGPPEHFRRGTLIPLYPTLSAQLAAVAREYSLPSTGGLVLYLLAAVDPTSPTATLAGSATLAGADGPRIGEEAWQLLWGPLFAPPPSLATLDAYFTDDDNEEEEDDDDDEDDDGLRPPIPPLPPIPSSLHHGPSSAASSTFPFPSDPTFSPEDSFQGPPSSSESIASSARRPSDTDPLFSDPESEPTSSPTSAAATTHLGSSTGGGRGGKSSTTSHAPPLPSSASSPTGPRSPPRREKRTKQQQSPLVPLAVPQLTFYGSGAVVGKVEFDIDWRRGGVRSRWYEGWAAAATSPASTPGAFDGPEAHEEVVRSPKHSGSKDRERLLLPELVRNRESSVEGPPVVEQSEQQQQAVVVPRIRTHTRTRSAEDETTEPGQPPAEVQGGKTDEESVDNGSIVDHGEKYPSGPWGLAQLQQPSSSTEEEDEEDVDAHGGDRAESIASDYDDPSLFAPETRPAEAPEQTEAETQEDADAATWRAMQELQAKDETTGLGIMHAPVLPLADDAPPPLPFTSLSPMAPQHGDDPAKETPSQLLASPIHLDSSPAAPEHTGVFPSSPALVSHTFASSPHQSGAVELDEWEAQMNDFPEVTPEPLAVGDSVEPGYDGPEPPRVVRSAPSPEQVRSAFAPLSDNNSSWGSHPSSSVKAIFASHLTMEPVHDANRNSTIRLEENLDDLERALAELSPRATGSSRSPKAASPMLSLFPAPPPIAAPAVLPLVQAPVAPLAQRSESPLPETQLPSTPLRPPSPDLAPEPTLTSAMPGYGPETVAETTAPTTPLPVTLPVPPPPPPATPLSLAHSPAPSPVQSPARSPAQPARRSKKLRRDVSKSPDMSNHSESGGNFFKKPTFGKLTGMFRKPSDGDSPTQSPTSPTFAPIEALPPRQSSLASRSFSAPPPTERYRSAALPSPRSPLALVLAPSPVARSPSNALSPAPPRPQRTLSMERSLSPTPTSTLRPALSNESLQSAVSTIPPLSPTLDPASIPTPSSPIGSSRSRDDTEATPRRRPFAFLSPRSEGPSSPKPRSSSRNASSAPATPASGMRSTSMGRGRRRLSKRFSSNINDLLASMEDVNNADFGDDVVSAPQPSSISLGDLNLERAPQTPKSHIALEPPASFSPERHDGLPVESGDYTSVANAMLDG